MANLLSSSFLFVLFSGLLLSQAVDPALLRANISQVTDWIDAGEYRNAEMLLREMQLANPSPGDQERGQILNAQASLHMNVGALAIAEDELGQARRLLEPLSSACWDLAAVLHNLAAIEMRTGRYDEAYAHSLRAVGLWEGFPPGHPQWIRAWASLASAEYLAGRAEDAKRSIQRAIVLAEKTYGREAGMIAGLLESEAVVLAKLHDRPAAKQARRRAALIKRSLKSSGQSQAFWNARDVK